MLHRNHFSILAVAVIASLANYARATGYYVVSTRQYAWGFQGFNTTPTHNYAPHPVGGDAMFANLGDFNGDGVPEVVVAQKNWHSVLISDFITATTLTTFSMGGGGFGGPITITASN